MKVRQPVFIWIAILLTAPLAYFVIDRIVFVRASQPVTGIVEKVWAQNSTCSSGSGRRKRRRSRPCTLFHAQVDYRVNGMTYDLLISAGDARGHNQPISRAQHRRGNRIPVVYDPRMPGRAYQDTFWDIWGAPVITFFVQMFALVGGFNERRR